MRIIAYQSGLCAMIWVATSMHAFAVWAMACWLLMLFSNWQSKRLLENITADHNLPRSAFEHQSVDIHIQVENNAKHEAAGLQLHDFFGPSIAEKAVVQTQHRIAPQSNASFLLRASCSRRWGSYQVGPILVSKQDSFSLSSSHRAFRSKQDRFDVFPKLDLIRALEEASGDVSMVERGRERNHAGQSLLYRGVRDYRGGDALRSIHWPASARRGQLTVKQFESNVQPHFSVFLDLNAKHLAGVGKKSTLDTMVRVSSSLLWTALQMREKVQIIGSSKQALNVQAGSGVLHLQGALASLLRLRQDGDTSLEQLVLEHLNELTDGSTVVLVYSSSATSWQQMSQSIDLLRKNNSRIYVLVIQNHTYVSMYSWRQSTEQIELNQQECRQGLAANGIPFLYVSSKDDLSEVLQKGSWS